MNHANLQKLYDWLAAGGDSPEAKFRMSNWLLAKKDCQTICCMGGYAETQMRKEFPEYGMSGVPSAIVWLDLEEADADDLFFPLDSGRSSKTAELLAALGIESYHQITPAMAARVVKYFIETELVDWSIAFGGEVS